ncbi:hypothetical protein B0H11DRAFT_1915211 [Mycena galericulata]|nr:hypothetical protein B0H11DRAFT_1915211 [Mycena galericulata]
MAKFTLTRAHVDDILDPTQNGDWTAFLGAIHPEVRWFIASEKKKNDTGTTGVYNLAGWQQEVAATMQPKLKGALKMFVSSVDVIGNKAIVEAYGKATQANGNPYNNKCEHALDLFTVSDDSYSYAWFLIFSEETGKIVEIREYLNTALVQEVAQTN